MVAVSDAAALQLPPSAGLCLLIEDRPSVVPYSDPRQAAIRLGLPCLEAGDVQQLRDAIGQALRLSRAGTRAVVLVVHDLVLRSADTIPVRPNRVVDTVEALIISRTTARRRAGRAEPGGVLRTARRLELNMVRCLPSPGERVPFGFLTVGPAETALQHLTIVLQLSGRVTALPLRLMNPLDESVVGRIATRCENLIVLEPRPGTVEAQVLAVTERLRHQGQRPAAVWGRTLPPDDRGESHELGPGEAVHPSILARKIAHLLHSVRPPVQVASQLVGPPHRVGVELAPRGTGIGVAAARRDVCEMLGQLDQWLQDGAALEDRGLPPSRVAIDGVPPEPPAPRLIIGEVWEPGRFQEQGMSGLRQAARDTRPWIFVVCDFASEDTQDLERLARGMIPEECADRVRIVLANLQELPALRDVLREAALEDRLTVIILRDGPPPQYHVVAMERELAEIDRLGFVPLQRSIWPADLACAFRALPDEPPGETRTVRIGSAPAPALSVDQLSRRVPGRFRLGVRVLSERVEVVRTRPPAQTWRRGLDRGLPLPSPVHAAQSRWRAHFAGFRGRTPGPAAQALCEAGRHMGFAVRTVYDPQPIGPGRRAWAQVLLTHPRRGEAPAPLAATIPFGEADLLVGLDPAEVLRAVALDPALRVAHVSRTCAVVNSGRFADEPATRHLSDAVTSTLAEVTRVDQLVIGEVATACQAWFRTDRITDLVLLGLAFQRGLIPVSVEAMEAGMERVESRGFARSMEAFQFGRRLALDERLFSRPRTDAGEDAEHTARRIAHRWHRSRWGGRARAERFEHMVRLSMEAMPGLTETEAGRHAFSDFVLGAHRCAIWGDLDLSQQYCDMLTALYHVDRGDRGRAITRDAVLPLAEAMLIREPLYVLAMATGSEQRRRLRLLFNVKPARGDRIEQRYRMRFELIASRRRFRLEVQFGATTARLLAGLRLVLPQRWRGIRRDRERRELVCDLIRRAALGAHDDYEHWRRVSTRLHRLAEEGSLHTMSAVDVLDSTEAETAAGITRTDLAAASQE
jgi:Pyruvate/2-oxoacid:ferredoxin oxidoreductase gamma subunit